MTFSAQNWLSASIILVSVSVVSKGLGFLRELLIAYYFGARAEVDAFMVALSLPMMLAGGIGVAFSSALVPSYHKAFNARGLQAGNAVIGSAVIWAIALSLLLLLPLVVIPLPFVHMVAPALSEATARQAASLTRWLAAYIVGLNLVCLLTAVFHAVHHFKIPAIADLAFNAVTILILLVYALTVGIQALVFGNLLGIVLCIAVLLIFLTKSNQVAVAATVSPKDISTLLLLVWPIFVMEVFTQLGGMAENYFAADLDEGTIAALSYAKRITTTIVALLALNLARGLFPTLSVMASEGRCQEAMSLLTRISKQLVVVVLPISVCLICYRQEILSLLYFRGAFDGTGLDMTSQAFTFYAAGLIVAVAEPMLIVTSYAFSDTRTPLVTSLLSMVVMIALLQFLTPLIGIGGIALSVSLSCLVRVSVMILCLQKRVNGLDLLGLVKIGATSLVCALIAFGPVSSFWSHPDSDVNEAISVGALSFAIYLVLAFLLMRDEVQALIRVLYQRVGHPLPVKA